MSHCQSETSTVARALRQIREGKRCSAVGKRALRRAYDATRRGECHKAHDLYRAGVNLCAPKLDGLDGSGGSPILKGTAIGAGVGAALFGASALTIKPTLEAQFPGQSVVATATFAGAITGAFWGAVIGVIVKVVS